ncbi:MAG: magnesium/cobalt transporter CorA [Halobacteriaceae archaeon]
MTVESVVYTPEGVESVADPDAAFQKSGTTWIRVTGPTPAERERVADICDVHPLAVEDVENGVRPKVEEFDGHTFLLVKGGNLTRGETSFEEELAEAPVGVFFGDDWLVTLSWSEPAAVDAAWEAVHRADGRLMRRGADFTAYRIVDGLVDGYFGVLDSIEDRIEAIEEDVVEDPDHETLVTINHARRELLSVRKLLWPTREAIGVLARGDPDYVDETTEKYYGDVYDHLVQLVDLAETYRDLTSGARDIYLNVLSMSTNEVMKRLTVVATIILPLTFVAGIYGMNFETMPELGWRYAYPASLLGMLGVAAILLAYFRREDWL